MKKAALKRAAKARLLFFRNLLKDESEPICKKCKGECCRACAGAAAYFPDRHVPVALQKKYNWNNKTGFHTEKGCSLPVNERAPLCLSYACSKIYNTLKVDGDFYYLMREVGSVAISGIPY